MTGQEKSNNEEMVEWMLNLRMPLTCGQEKNWGIKSSVPNKHINTFKNLWPNCIWISDKVISIECVNKGNHLKIAQTKTYGKSRIE